MIQPGETIVVTDGGRSFTGRLVEFSSDYDWHEKSGTITVDVVDLNFIGQFGAANWEYYVPSLTE